VTEKVSHPFWGPNGGHLAFVSWTPSQQDITSGHNTGDMVQGGQIWITGTDGKQMTGTPKLLVPRADNVTSYYPAISDDDLYVVFNQSSCTGPANTGGWGAGACDGYNDISATLHVVPVNGGAPIALTKANGGDNPLTTNSWPRWSPFVTHFHGHSILWVTFSSNRDYGLHLVNKGFDNCYPPEGPTYDQPQPLSKQGVSYANCAQPQIWMAGVIVDTDPNADKSDRSFPAFWLPFQDVNSHNHSAQWVEKVLGGGGQTGDAGGGCAAAGASCGNVECCSDTVCCNGTCQGQCIK